MYGLLCTLCSHLEFYIEVSRGSHSELTRGFSFDISLCILLKNYLEICTNTPNLNQFHSKTSELLSETKTLTKTLT